jgi:hypothetical protein
MMKDVDRSRAWLTTHIKMASPQALTGTAEKKSELEASLPKHPNAPAVPDPLWAPISGALLLLAAGVIGLLIGKPFILPSLGPTAYLLAVMPAHPSSRWYAVVMGHLVGLLVGFGVVAAMNIWSDPIVLQTGILSGGRMVASVIALLITVLVAYLLRATHPPAGATTLLVTLGSVQTTEQVLFLMGGAIVIALLGEGLRRVRLGQWLSRAAAEPRTPLDPGRPLVGSKKDPLRGSSQ